MVVLSGTAVCWCQGVEQAVESESLPQFFDKCVEDLTGLTDLVRGQLSAGVCLRPSSGRSSAPRRRSKHSSSTAWTQTLSLKVSELRRSPLASGKPCLSSSPPAAHTSPASCWQHPEGQDSRALLVAAGPAVTAGPSSSQTRKDLVSGPFQSIRTQRDRLGGAKKNVPPRPNRGAQRPPLRCFFQKKLFWIAGTPHRLLADATLASRIGRPSPPRGSREGEGRPILPIPERSRYSIPIPIPEFLGSGGR